MTRPTSLEQIVRLLKERPSSTTLNTSLTKKTGAQVKGNFASNKKYYNSTTGALVINSYVQVDKDWYYVAMTVNA